MKGERVSVKDVLAKQLALDYCCEISDVLDGGNHFTVFETREGRRRFGDSGDDCFLKAAVYGGKLLVTGREDIIGVVSQKWANYSGEWFFDGDSLAEIDRLITPFGYGLDTAHPFFVPGDYSGDITAEINAVWYEGEAIEQFRGDSRFGEAYAFCPTAPDMLGVAAVDGAEILAMAGASADSPYMWQIGIGTLPNSRGKGIATALVKMLKDAVLDRGILPFYGTSMSHIASQRVALRAGFVPAWAEFVTKKINADDRQA